MASDRSKLLWERSVSLAEYATKTIMTDTVAKPLVARSLWWQIPEILLRFGSRVLPDNDPVFLRIFADARRGKLIVTGFRREPTQSPSIALAQPDGMERPDFLRRANAVVEWFRPLDPYGFDEPILKVEKINYAIGTTDHLPLYCYAVASKRYALFNVTDDNMPILRKASAHGLGQYSAPYGDDDCGSGFPPPIKDLKAGKDRLARWQHDVWYAIISHELSGAKGLVRFDYHPALARPLISRYHASSPEMLRWLKPYNDRFENYADQVKPFGALYALASDDLVTAERATEDLRMLVASSIRRQPGYILAAFERAASERYLAIDPALHDRIVSEGQSAIENDDLAGVNSATFELYRNRAEADGPSGDLAMLAGLMSH